MQTETINVDESGERSTYQSAIDKKIIVWMFGGSTMFGTGSADFQTIPSYLVQIGEKTGQGIEARNFGTSGFVHLQERQLLEKNIMDAVNLPTYVIFLDGINEVFAAYQSGCAGSINNQEKLVQKIIIKIQTYLLKKHLKNQMIKDILI